ncbi:hypothetical protein MHBO_003358 [Bonamia ostreae]|uniref:Uncharacterized protein n=1 Tax=Bonamia ostreae TaxID=126728 RepID=A0ABV2AQ61_9EUKA
MLRSRKLVKKSLLRLRRYCQKTKVSGDSPIFPKIDKSSVNPNRKYVYGALIFLSLYLFLNHVKNKNRKSHSANATKIIKSAEANTKLLDDKIEKARAEYAKLQRVVQAMKNDLSENKNE